NVHGPERLPHRAHAGLAHRPPVTASDPGREPGRAPTADHALAALRGPGRGANEPGREPAIALAGAARRMGRETVLDGLDLEIAAGRVVVLRGANGAGKTTLLRMLATRLRPTRGRGRVFGFDLVTQAA